MEVLTAKPAAHCRRAGCERVGDALIHSAIHGLFLVIEEADAVSRPGASMAVFAGVGNAIQILARGQVWGQKRRVLVPRRVLEIVFGS